jgi:hypothetical protein
MKWVLWAVMFFLTKITYITNHFAVVDKWNAEEAVAEYLQKAQTRVVLEAEKLLSIDFDSRSRSTRFDKLSK